MDGLQEVFYIDLLEAFYIDFLKFFYKDNPEVFDITLKGSSIKTFWKSSV